MKTNISALDCVTKRNIGLSEVRPHGCTRHPFHALPIADMAHQQFVQFIACRRSGLFLSIRYEHTLQPTLQAAKLQSALVGALIAA